MPATLVKLGERDYARFCRAFEHAATQEILRHDPASVVVLSNDIAEGPGFAGTHRGGYRISRSTTWTSRLYRCDLCARLAESAQARRVYDLVRPLPMPDIARLIFDKQWSSVEYSRGLIVPSSAMKTTLLDCYAALEPESVHVVPWGVPDQQPPTRKPSPPKSRHCASSTACPPTRWCF